MRWRGLLAVNDFRNAVGLEPVRLDDDRSRGCRMHAEYIRLNSGDGMGHEEIPGRPGYSEEGVAAGRESVMDATGDPRGAVAHLTAMM
ncbi:MAG: CAP domain-containing protein, partial [Planctomycetota bacterium]